MPRVQCEIEGPVRKVVLSRPAKCNALDAEMLPLLAESFSGEPGEEERVAVLVAEGPVFCSGLDVKELRRGSLVTSDFEAALRALEEWPLPVVAQVQGDAIAGGAELALHCDLVVASANASFAMPVAHLGLVPSWFLTKKLLEVVGPATTREILLLGEPLTARQLRELGVLTRVVPRHQLETTVHSVVTRLTDNAPLALQAIKKLIRRGMAFRDETDHQDLDTLVAQVRDSQDAEEGLIASLERRPARFIGR